MVRRVTLTIALGSVLATSASFAAELAERQAERDAMVATQIAARGVVDPRVLGALRRVPRHRFVPAAVTAHAYDDSPLPIGAGQTISQPFIVGTMTELLHLRPDDSLFELGTGSGYQAAVASLLCRHVYSVEIEPGLAERSGRTLGELGYHNVSVRAGDGYRGWPEAAPFDAMIFTAAVPAIPEKLLAQLKVGGRAVMPVGPAGEVQQLVVVEKTADGGLRTRTTLAVRFVPAHGEGP